MKTDPRERERRRKAAGFREGGSTAKEDGNDDDLHDIDLLRIKQAPKEAATIE